jgi:hypothetical protein
LIINPGLSSRPTDLDGLRLLMALIISESETDDIVKNSEDDKKGGEDNRTRIVVH